MEATEVRWGLVVAAVGMLGGMAACSGEGGSKQATPMRAVPPMAPEVVAQQDPGVAREQYRYDPEGKPDPFRSFVRVTLEPGEGLSSPLQRFDLSQLMVTGLLWGTENARALIEDPAGKGYIVGVGTAVGKNQGRVVRIGDNRVVVKETYVDFHDRATTKEVEMHLYKAQGG